MSFPHLNVLHGDPCDCTLHDVGLNCRHRMTSVGLTREVDEVVVAALRSGFSAVDVTQAFMLAVERHGALEIRS